MPPTKRATSVKMSFRFAATQLNYHLSYVKICNAKKIHLYQRSIRHVRNEYLIMSQFYSTTFPKICQPFYEKIKNRTRCNALWQTVCQYAVPALFIVIGLLFLFNQGNTVQWVFIVSGIFTIAEGGFLLANAIVED